MPRSGYQSCPYCRGTGAENSARGGPCQACQGSGEKNFLRLLRWYHLFDGQLTASQQSAYTLQIEPEADFEWIALVSTQTGAFATTMKDGSSGRAYESAATNAATTVTQTGAVTNGNRFGTASLPFRLPVPEVLPMKSVLSGLIIDLSVATNTIQASIVGYNLYTEDNLPAGLSMDQMVG